MTTQSTIKRWSAIDDSDAESLSGGRGRSRGASVIAAYYGRLAPSAAPAAAPAAPRQFFETTFTPNALGGPATETKVAIPSERNVTRFGGVVASGTILSAT
jgi:hypothetical protein